MRGTLTALAVGALGIIGTVALANIPPTLDLAPICESATYAGAPCYWDTRLGNGLSPSYLICGDADRVVLDTRPTVRESEVICN